MAAQPDFSIIIPTFGRPAKLRACLSSIRLLDYPASHYEVIVVDDGGEPPVDVTSLNTDFPCRLRVIRQSNAGPAIARNHGASAAAGRYLVFTDDDCRPHRQWLRELKSSLELEPGCAVAGLTRNALPHRFWPGVSQVLLDYLFEYFNGHPERPGFFISNNLALPAPLFGDTGGFDERFPLAAAEDRELCDRWCDAFGSVTWSQRAIVDHYHDMGLPGFLRQHFNYGRGARLFHLARRSRDAGGVKLEGWDFYKGMLLFPLMKSGVVRGAALSAGVFLAQVANIAGYGRQCLSGKPFHNERH